MQQSIIHVGRHVAKQQREQANLMIDSTNHKLPCRTQKGIAHWADSVIEMAEITTCDEEQVTPEVLYIRIFY
jgi:hypothetical protein